MTMVHEMNKDKKIILIPKKQQGMVLVVALIMLLLITILGVSAVNRSGISTQVAGNSMFSMLVYQGAESALAKSVAGGAEINIKQASKLRPNSQTVKLAAEKIQKGGSITLQSTVTYITDIKCPVINGIAYSSTVVCEVYQTDAQARLQSTSARARHMEGRAIPKP